VMQRSAGRSLGGSRVRLGTPRRTGERSVVPAPVPVPVPVVGGGAGAVPISHDEIAISASDSEILRIK
jgi:hypothetical protein